MPNENVKACPFYRTDYREHIRCEDTSIEFEDEKTRREYARKYCTSPIRYKECKEARRLIDKYERLDEIQMNYRKAKLFNKKLY